MLHIQGNYSLGYIIPFRYKSYYYDSEIEWYYLQSRYYFPTICRFINCDDVNYIGVTESEFSYNPFAYCENEPIINVDYTGEYILSKRLSYQLTIALGILIILFRILTIVKDIKAIYSITKSKLQTACFTALGYSQLVITAEIVNYICSAVIAASVIGIILNFFIVAMTGFLGRQILKVVTNIVICFASWYLPGLAVAIKMIYFAHKYKKGVKIRYSFWSLGIIF